MGTKERNESIDNAINVLNDLKNADNPCTFVLLASRIESNGDITAQAKYWGSGPEQIGLLETMAFKVKTTIMRAL